MRAAVGLYADTSLSAVVYHTLLEEVRDDEVTRLRLLHHHPAASSS